MNKMYIPPLGFTFKLTEDWQFKLYDEHRNSAMLEAARLVPPYRRAKFEDLTRSEKVAQFNQPGSQWFTDDGALEASGRDLDWLLREHAYTNFVLRKESELKVERIYIRRGGEPFNSVTLRATTYHSAGGDPLFRPGVKMPKSLRFWVKLEDFNKIHFDMI